tara:strand:- start:553 stop:1158 length:606 start_codon:yes stop_codon:yes gene_type:complete
LNNKELTKEEEQIKSTSNNSTNSNIHEDNSNTSQSIDEEEICKKYLNQIKYLQADIDNYRKNINLQINQAVFNEKKRIFLNLFNTREDLERAINSFKKDKKSHQNLKGVKLVFENLIQLFEDEGLAEIASINSTFNSSFHEAIKIIETNDYEDNTIISEIRKGYTLNGKVIRTSLVEVTKKPISLSTDAKDEQNIINSENK